MDVYGILLFQMIFLTQIPMNYVSNLFMSVCIPFGQAFYTHRQYGLHSHLSHHDAYIMGIPLFCQYIMVFSIVNPKGLFLAYTNKCFCLDLQVCFSQPAPRFFYMRRFRYFSHKLTMHPFFLPTVEFLIGNDFRKCPYFIMHAE